MPGNFQQNLAISYHKYKRLGQVLYANNYMHNNAIRTIKLNKNAVF